MESQARPIPGFLARICRHFLSPATYRSACSGLHRVLVYWMMPRTSERAASDRKYLGNLLALLFRRPFERSEELVEELLSFNRTASVPLGDRHPQRRHLLFKFTLFLFQKPQGCPHHLTG